MFIFWCLDESVYVNHFNSYVRTQFINFWTHFYFTLILVEEIKNKKRCCSVRSVHSSVKVFGVHLQSDKISVRKTVINNRDRDTSYSQGNTSKILSCRNIIKQLVWSYFDLLFLWQVVISLYEFYIIYLVVLIFLYSKTFWLCSWIF